jgi:AraC-like DNA-binding protein
VREGKARYALKDVAKLFPSMRNMGLRGAQGPLPLNHRVAYFGPLTVFDLAFETEFWVDWGEERSYYQVNVPVAGHIEAVHNRSSISVRPGFGMMCVPEGDLTIPRWEGGRTLALRVERNVVEDALSDAIGRELTSQIAFTPVLSTAQGPARSWMQMLLMLNQELRRPDSALNQPLVAAPFAHSFMRTLLLAADHPDRAILVAQAKYVAPHTIRTAVDIIEAEPHLPVTVASLASRCHISTRALQQGFIRHLGIPPMTYLRQVRLKRAHQELLAADPSVNTVALIAKRWGFTNPGRFAAAHTARYGEAPAETLRRLGRLRSGDSRLHRPTHGCQG